MNNINRITIYTSYLFSIFLLLLAIINFISELGVSEWDTDHEIYFAQRLLHGELLFTREFHDKLPLVQYYFIFSALLKNINYALIMNFLLVICSAFTVLYIVRMLLRFSHSIPYSRPPYALYFMTLSTYVYLFTEFSGGFYHINPAASSFFVFYVAFLVQYGLIKSQTYSFTNKMTFLLIGAFFAFAAISFRPYYFLPVLLLLFWISSRDILFKYMIAAQSLYTLQNILEFILKSFVLLLFFLIVSFMIYIFTLYIIPYYYTGNLSIFYYSIRLLMSKLNPQGPEYIFMHQYQYFLSLSVFSKSIIITSIISSPILFCVKKFYLSKTPHTAPNIYHAISNSLIYDLFFLGPLSLICLDFSVVTQHYWDHYWQLCIPFFMINNMLAAYFVIFTLRHYKLSLNILKLNSDILVVSKIISCIILSIFFYNLFLFKYLNTKFTLTGVISETYRIIDPPPVILDIDPILNNRKFLGFQTDFLHTHNMFSHWILSESRHGFPHASHFGHIDQMWFADLRINPLVTGIVTTPSALCRKLNYMGPTLLFVPISSRIYSCLGFEEPRFYSIETFIQSNNTAVFVRNVL